MDPTDVPPVHESSDVLDDEPATIAVEGLTVSAVGLPAVSTDGSTVAWLSTRREDYLINGGAIEVDPLFDLDRVDTSTGALRRLAIVRLQDRTVDEDAAQLGCVGDQIMCTADPEVLARMRQESAAHVRDAVASARAALAEHRWRSLRPVDEIDELTLRIERDDVLEEDYAVRVTVQRADSTVIAWDGTENPMGDVVDPDCGAFDGASAYADPGSSLVVLRVECRTDEIGQVVYAIGR